MLKLAILLVAVSTALALPAKAMGAFPHVPSSWPAEGAFEPKTAPMISTKGTTQPVVAAKDR